jgi:hypothetical protein
VGMRQPGAPPIAATQVQTLAFVLKQVQLVRRETVLVPRVKQDHFRGIQLDVGPDEKQVVRLTVRLIVETLDPDDAGRDIRVQGVE